MNHSSELKSLYKKLNARFQYYINKRVKNDPANFFNFPIILKIIFGIPILLTLIIIPAILLSNDVDIYGLIIALLVYFYFIGVIMSLLFKAVLMKYYYTNLANINDLIGSNTGSIDLIPIILKKIRIINFLYKTKFYIFLNPNSVSLELQYLILLLTDLRSNLSIRLIEQQSTLESAKSEVEKNITGITELNQVSELQRARLDKQIEQFEELQRVLVKV